MSDEAKRYMDEELEEMRPRLGPWACHCGWQCLAADDKCPQGHARPYVREGRWLATVDAIRAELATAKAELEARDVTMAELHAASIEAGELEGAHQTELLNRLNEVREELRQARDWEDVHDEWSDAIDAAFPTRSGSHKEYAVAMEMVGHRHSKGSLVELVNWLLVERDEANGHLASIKNSIDFANKTTDAYREQLRTTCAQLADRDAELASMTKRYEVNTALMHARTKVMNEANELNAAYRWQATNLREALRSISEAVAPDVPVLDRHTLQYIRDRAGNALAASPPVAKTAEELLAEAPAWPGHEPYIDSYSKTVVYRPVRAASPPVDQGAEPECPGPNCQACNGEACDLCGAGMSTDPHRPKCEHDVIQRHSPATQEARRGRRGPVDQGAKEPRKAKPWGSSRGRPACPHCDHLHGPGTKCDATDRDGESFCDCDGLPLPPVDQGAEPMGAVELSKRWRCSNCGDDVSVDDFTCDDVLCAHCGRVVSQMPIADTPREEKDHVDRSRDGGAGRPDSGQDSMAGVAPSVTCACAAIQAADPARHFKGRPRRVERKTSFAMACSLCGDDDPICFRTRVGEQWLCMTCIDEGPPADKPTTARVVLHLKTQRGQPYGSERRCCEQCGVMLIGKEPHWTDDASVWKSPPEGYAQCGADEAGKKEKA